MGRPVEAQALRAGVSVGSDFPVFTAPWRGRLWMTSLAASGAATEEG